MRKISLKKLTYDLKENDVERELTIYLSQYIMQMYQDYLFKKKVEKGIEDMDSNMQTLKESSEESKTEKSSSTRTGDKYIIRKLISLKITPEHIQDYINLVISGTTNNTQFNDYGMQPFVQNNMPNINYMEFNQSPFMQVPQVSSHQRSNSCYANDNQMNIPQVQNTHMMDDFQLINGFAQFNLSNQNGYYNLNNLDFYNLPAQSNNQNESSLENNFSNYEGQLSSVPAHMKNRPGRAHSISKMPERSQYMQDSFLFDKMADNTASKDDTVIRIDLHPLNLGQMEPSTNQYAIFRNKIEAGKLSNSSRSSLSSFVSINDGASCSSLDVSFDELGNPYLRPFKQSAFSKVKKADSSDLSQSQDSEEQRNKETERHMEFDDGSYEDSKHQNKSSFFRLKGNGGEEG